MGLPEQRVIPDEWDCSGAQRRGQAPERCSTVGFVPNFCVWTIGDELIRSVR
jgi:hypothetical protein